MSHHHRSPSPIALAPASSTSDDVEKKSPRHVDGEKGSLGDDGLPAYGYEDEIVPIKADKLNRTLTARQVQMIAIGGTIGTGLFLGTGKSLATGGPASMLICYIIIGVIVFLTMLALGEMASFIPVAGSFCTFAGRFVDDAFGFALTWNYWFNDAVSTAADLVALQLVWSYWNTAMPGWGLSLIFWVVLILANIITVKAYGELEYWLSLLKIITIIIFIFLGIAVNAGGNTSNHYIGGENWRLPGAPFVGGIGGFASVFVTASFAYGGTESIAITAGETASPHKNIPRVIKNVFWRILLFYVISILLIGLDVAYTTPDLSTKNSATSPFTLVFQMVGSNVAGSFINAMIMTSVLSAGNHALFAGTRLLFTLAVNGHAPAFFGKLNRNRVPWVAVLATTVDVASEYRRGIESALLDLYRYRIDSLPRRLGGTGKNPPPHLQELDVPLRPMVRGDRMQFPGSGARVELFQSAVQCGGFRELLYRVTGHGTHVCGLETAEEDEDCGAEGDGFGNGCVSSRAGGGG
ncbi:hypothetical protein V499_07588 [Pseudogymnoascus sp. VKM F-103]|nr:hypothetical protein V499_07588 [Pseudogymnoascus sp. VKM F-103]